jgi:hypothetical protein
VGGVPEIVGAGSDVEEVLARTCMANAGRVALFQPSLTAITMFEYVPTLPAEGLPESCPVLLLKVAHEGWLLIAKTRVRPDVALADGVNEKACPAVTLVAGDPEIVT